MLSTGWAWPSCFPKETEWTRAARRLVPGLLGLSALSFVLLLGTEVFERLDGQDVAMSPPAVVAVVAVLLAGGGAALIAAVVPGRDPLGLSERGRTAYVYGCEVLLAGLLLHLRLTEPWLFSGFFVRYRPLIILGVAFLGVGLSEIFRRQGRLVLAEPLERTGALLPALPLLGAYWVEPRPGEDTLFLVLAGGLYTLLSFMRSSLGFGALAALAYNGAVWVVLGRREGFGLLEHPQLWVIPPAFCVLIGAYLNRDRLSEAQTTSIRYAASLAIYLSSTSDIILTGVAQAPWLPLVLGALSLVGIFAGIFLRVRGFLFLGLGFLGLSLFTIIWYAAVDLRQTWLWSASGIVVGIMILACSACSRRSGRKSCAWSSKSRNGTRDVPGQRLPTMISGWCRSSGSGEPAAEVVAGDRGLRAIIQCIIVLPFGGGRCDGHARLCAALRLDRALRPPLGCAGSGRRRHACLGDGHPGRTRPTATGTRHRRLAQDSLHRPRLKSR